MKNSVKILREAKNLTQNELAEKSGLSLRTIQRIEAGNVLKGFTLNAIARALETRQENVTADSVENDETARAKLINLSALSGLVLPFGGIIFPLILTFKTADSTNKTLGKQIVSVQILLTAVLSVLMIISPFLQKSLALQFPLFMVFLAAFILIKLYIIFRNGMSLNQKNDLDVKLKYPFL